MANKHYTIGSEVEVTIKVKISNIVISTHNGLTEDQVLDNLNDFKVEIGDHIKKKMSQKTYNQEEVTDGVDWWSFDIE